MIDRRSLKGYGKDEYDISIRDDVAEFLFAEIQKRRPKRVLEIGTYIGFSASVMLSACEETMVVSVDKDDENIGFAKQNLSKFGNRFEIIKGDALEVVKKLESENEEFDFVLVDGPKSQYPKYIPYLKKMLKSGGVIMADNIHFHGFVNGDGKVAHKHRTAVNRIKEFLKTMQEDSDFSTEVFDIGDGVSFSVKS